MKKESTAMNSRRLGYFLPQDEGKVEVGVSGQDFSSENLEALFESIRVIFELQPILIALEICEQNHQELAELPASLRSRLAPYTSGVVPIGVLLDILAITGQRVTNFLASVSAFLDQTNTGIKRTYGKKSVEATEWNGTRKTLHSERFSYRFLYDLRNFGQHIAIPFSNLKVRGTRASSGAPIDTTVDILISREGLLNAKFGWGKVRAEIEELSESFPLLPLANEYLDSMRHLCLKAIELHSSRLEECARLLESALSVLAPPEGAVPVLFKRDPRYQESMLHEWEDLPIAPLRRILAAEHRLRESVTGKQV